MIAGRLRYQVIFLQDIESRSETGAAVKEFAPFVTVRADVRDLKSELRFMSQSFNSIVTKQLYLRHIDGLEAGMRFEFDGVMYQTEKPLDKKGTRRELEILASEVVDA